MRTIVSQVNRLVSALRRARSVFHAANCALWLLEQEELRDLMDGEWGDPPAIRDLLREAGCEPRCDRDDVFRANKKINS